MTLERLIAEEVARAGPITFARFMALALYHPTLGYYAGGGVGREPLGWSGDYFTSADVHPLWGWAIARQLHQMWELLGCPTRFDVVEPGAGRGLLALEVWRYALERAPEWATALRYTLTDRAPAGSPLRSARERRLGAALAQMGVPTTATRWLNAPADAPSDAGAQGAPAAPAAEDGLVGCVVSNELVDALPVHRVEARGGELYEWYVTLETHREEAHGGRLVEQLGPPSSPAVATYFDRFRVPWRTYPDGWRAEICLEAEPWLRQATAALRRGFVLTIDYGDTARRLYTRDRHGGTLMVYARHQVGERPLVYPGRQDITAHVNFSALRAAGRAVGLPTAGFTTQADFLLRLGVREEAAAIAARRFPAADTERHTDRGQADYLRRGALRAAVATLLDPHGLGGFRVLAQHRGMPGAGHHLLGIAGAEISTRPRTPSPWPLRHV
ncbi:MAG: SAM-dependent methyltransferase [Ktedonobacterales bacterium]|nr:SAM-dependent methyltransferase [Ktedonobacterales bacterium]